MANDEISNQGSNSGQNPAPNPNESTGQGNQIPNVPPQDRTIIEKGGKSSGMETK